DLFYKRNTTKFFKNRNWIGREFTELSFNDEDLCPNDQKASTMKFLSLYSVLIVPPLIALFPVVLFRISSEDRIRIRMWSGEFHFSDNLKDHISSAIVDIVSIIFVLSAIPPEHHSYVVRNVSEVTRKGSILCFRDYAQFDETQLKFAATNEQHKLQENFYVRQDGTMSYFFTLEYLREIFENDQLFKMIDGGYVTRETINRAKDLCIDRRFLQAKFERL
ncbi:17838_t:CDS:2, partial [Acaulospora morrowiae]